MKQKFKHTEHKPVIQTRLEESLVDRLDFLAFLEKETRSSKIRKIIIEYLNNSFNEELEKEFNKMIKQS